MNEDYVSFETAKLLKEKGFDENCSRSYVKDKLAVSQGFNNSYYTTMYSDASYRPVSAPTLQMAMKWLREKHGLNVYALAVWKDVEIQYGDWEEAVVGYDWVVESLSYNNSPKTSTGKPFRTYEQACEAGIKYCLENLI